MPSRKSKDIYIAKCFMGVRGTSMLTCSYIVELHNGQSFKCENKPFIVFILILRRVLI